MKENEQSLREMCNTIMHKHAHNGSTRRRGEKGTENNITRNNGQKQHPKFDESQSTYLRNSINCKQEKQRDPQRHITVKMLKYKGKEKILKAAGEKGLITYKGIPLRLI